MKFEEECQAETKIALMNSDGRRQDPAVPAGTVPPFSLMKWVLLGGALTILLPGASIFLWAWITGQTFNPAGGSTGRGSAFDAMLYTYLYVLFLGLPAFAVWSIVCFTVSLVKKGKSIK